MLLCSGNFVNVGCILVHFNQGEATRFFYPGDFRQCGGHFVYVGCILAHFGQGEVTRRFLILETFVKVEARLHGGYFTQEFEAK